MSSDEVDEKELLSRNPQTPAEMVAYGIELKNHGNTIFGRKDYKGALKFYGKIFQWVNHLDQSSLKGMVPIDTESEAPKELLEEAKALRIGAGARTMALLEDVPIWYELWRKLNGFPPNYYQPETDQKKTAKKE